MEIFRKISCFGIFFLLNMVSAKNMGSINIEGVDGPIYVIAPDWSEEFVSVHDDGFTLSRGGRIYFAKDPVDDFNDPSAYWQTPLIGHHLSYEIGKYLINNSYMKMQCSFSLPI